MAACCPTSLQVSIVFEYVRNNGFIPLIAIAQAIDASVSSDTFIAGAKLSF